MTHWFGSGVLAWLQDQSIWFLDDFWLVLQCWNHINGQYSKHGSVSLFLGSFAKAPKLKQTCCNLGHEILQHSPHPRLISSWWTRSWLDCHWVPEYQAYWSWDFLGWANWGIAKIRKGQQFLCISYIDFIPIIVSFMWNFAGFFLRIRDTTE